MDSSNHKNGNKPGPNFGHKYGHRCSERARFGMLRRAQLLVVLCGLGVGNALAQEPDKALGPSTPDVTYDLVRTAHSNITSDITSDGTTEIKTRRPLNLRRPHSFDYQTAGSGTAGASNLAALDIEHLGSSQIGSSELGSAHPAQRSTPRYALASSHIDRHQLDHGTRVIGWRLGDEVFFGRSKGDLSGVALIWQRSQTDQVSLSGNGLKLTRRLN